MDDVEEVFQEPHFPLFTAAEAPSSINLSANSFIVNVFVHVKETYCKRPLAKDFKLIEPNLPLNEKKPLARSRLSLWVGYLQ